jgi:hypothetical protein
MGSRVRFLIMLGVFLLGGCLPNERPDVAYAREIRVFRLGPGDQVRLIVFDQPSLSNIYGIDAGACFYSPCQSCESRREDNRRA